MSSRSACLILGGTGLLGKALLGQLQSDGINCITVARNGADAEIDLSSGEGVSQLKKLPHFPEVIVNCAALVDLKECQLNPAKAMDINADLPRRLAEFASENKSYLVQISTDHYYCGDNRATHSETDPISIQNIYAESKYMGEQNALKHRDTLVIRTNVVGIRGWPSRPTFAEWAIQSLQKGVPFTAFTDFYTSSIDAAALSKAISKLIYSKRPRGILNVASSQVSSKFEFISSLAEVMGIDSRIIQPGSLSSLAGPARADSLGLNVKLAEEVLGWQLPGLYSVVKSIFSEYNSQYEI